jgi:hypothetical protein
MFASRTFRDSRGTTWRVMQWHVGRFGALEPVPALIFTSRHERTEVRGFPSDWMTLGDGDLERLRLGAAVPTDRIAVAS